MQTSPQSNEEFTRSLHMYSDAIKVARVICIFMMAYVHVYLFFNAEFQSTGYFIAAKSILVELFGRSSVPLLSIISGYLMVGYFRRNTWLKGVRKRFFVLIIPLIAWNLIGISFALLAGHVVDVNIADAIFGLTDNTFYIHLTFLRDIFIVIVISPGIIYLTQRFHVLFLMAVIVFTTIFDLAPFVLRDQIFIYFVAGVYLGIYPIPELVKSKSFFYTMASMILLICLQISFPYYPEPLYFMSDTLFDDLFRRPVCAIAFWLVSLQICRYRYIEQNISKYLEPPIFLMFLSHALFVHIYGAIYAYFEGLHSAPIYFMVWLGMPVACLVSAVFMYRALRVLPEIVPLVIIGKRISPNYA